MITKTIIARSANEVIRIGSTTQTVGELVRTGVLQPTNNPNEYLIRSIGETTGTRAG